MSVTLIFDLDLTICNNCMDGYKKEAVLNILDAALLNNWSVYVITARRTNAFKSLGDLLSYDIPEEIVKKLKECNKYKKLKEWVFCNEHDSSATFKVDELLMNFPYLFLSYENMIHFINKITFDVGIHKMMQIDNILRKEKHNPKKKKLCILF